EVHEVEQREVLLELLCGDVQPLDQLVRGDLGLTLLAAGREEIGEERLEDGEALRRNGSRRPRGRLVAVLLLRGGSYGRRLALVRLEHALERFGHLAAELLRLERHGASLLPQHPGGEERDARVLGDEDAVLEAAAAPVDTLDPPGRVGADLDARLALG